jgi:sulfofructose kinase
MIVGFGENSVDLVLRLPRCPQPGTPDSKVEIERRDVRPGGQVATTLATCAALGHSCRYLGAFGNDDNAALIRQELIRRGVDVSHAVIRDAPNRYAVILIDGGGERVVLWQKDARLRLGAADIRRDWLAGATLVHVDATDEDAAISLGRLARDAGLPVTSDVDHVTARMPEFLEAVTIPIVAEPLPLALTGATDMEQALRAMRLPHHTHIVVTLGARGSAMLEGDRFVTMPGVAVNVVDSTGAGDVFRGAFIAALCRGERADALLQFANAVAADSCTRTGAIGGVPER